MTQSLQLGGGPGGTGAPKDIRRLNRLPIVAAAVLGILFLAVIFYGLTSRGSCLIDIRRRHGWRCARHNLRRSD